jgi:3-oxoacyl-[acyl-carrier protein] reductase
MISSRYLVQSSEVTMLQGQTVLVTGASRGIGKEIALELARNGYRVAVNYYNEAASLVDATIAEIRSLQADVLAIEADIRSSSQVAAMFERVIATFGRLDLLVNNAGVQTWKPLLEVTEEEWDLVVDTNLKGCFLCTQQAARYMKDHGGGSIVNLGSGGLHREQGRNRDVHQGGCRRTGPLWDTCELHCAGLD